MSKFELSITKDYVSSWGVVEAAREFFQNALDQQTVMPNNAMFFKYNEETQTLSVGNKHSVLEANSLLLGATTKKEQKETIGKFGEGYKIATLVFLREGKEVVFYNYGAREVWRPRFVNSRRYKTEILTFFTDKKYIWQSTPDNNLTIEIKGITPEEYELIIESNLHLQEPHDTTKTKYGDILLAEKYKGHVFVNGLYICHYEKYDYGYDFKPGYIELDRDRKLVSDFDLQWLSSRMWSDVPNDIAATLSARGSADVAYLSHMLSSPNLQTISNQAVSTFKDTYGDKSIPVVSQEELDLVPQGHKGIVVPYAHKALLSSSSSYNKITLVKRKTLKEQVNDWLLDWEDEISPDARATLEEILKEEKDDLPW